MKTLNFRSLFSRKPKPATAPTAPATSTTTTTAPAPPAPPPHPPPRPTGLSSLFNIFSSNRSTNPKPPKTRRHHRRISIAMYTDLPRIFITADTDEFDPTEIAKWQAEGYEVEYIPRADTHALELLGDTIESHEKYCIIAYGTAATIALEYAMFPVGSLACLIAYYPTGLPTAFANATFPKRLRRIILHISDSQPFGFDSSKVECPSLKVRVYQDTKPGFAEKITVHYNPIATSLAQSRTLAAVRETLGPDVDLEDIWGDHLIQSLIEKDANKTLDSMVKEPYVNHVPTLVGGSGYTELHRFYHEYFIPDNPPSLGLRLISRTVGADRIVDEMILSFTHTTEISWMLPGVKPTGRKVVIPIVFIVCIKAKKLYAEHVYWDQASVLKQIGAVDFSGLPVSGAEEAWKVLDKDCIPNNVLLNGWDTTSKDGSDLTIVSRW
ncbi:hypothetical protein TWF281_003195 [Arthrobotrys megalospora]